MASHNDTIVDQFTRQAVPFATAAPIRDAAALQLIVAAARTTASDTVLDVACGPGLVACAFARTARHVTGIDLTPAMLEHARGLAAKDGRTTNLSSGRRPAAAVYRRVASIVVSLCLHHFPIRRCWPRCGGCADQRPGSWSPT
jgi:SAM-dependent methyltransferase